MAENPGELKRAIELGLQVLGSGAGSYLGALAGDPALAAIAAMGGTTVAEVGGDVVARVLSPRQEARVGAVFLAAGAALKAKEVLGATIRDDEFWVGEHSTGSEFAEGVLLAAKDCFEERKIPYIANMLANVAIHSEIDGATANSAIRTAEQLSWVEFCLLGVIDRPEQFPRMEAPLARGVDWPDGTVKSAWVALSDTHRLVRAPRKNTSEGIFAFDTNLSAASLTDRGLLATKLMELGDIPHDELYRVWEALHERRPEGLRDE